MAHESRLDADWQLDEPDHTNPGSGQSDPLNWCDLLLADEGNSLSPIFRGKQRHAQRVLFFSVPRNQAVRIGDWKLVNAQRGAPWELYYLKTDPTETNNVAEHHPEKVERMGV